MLDQQRGCRINAIPGKYARTTGEATTQDGARRIQPVPLLQQYGIVRVMQRFAPEHAAMVLGQAAAQSGKLLEITLTRLGSFVVGDAGHDHPTRRAQRQRTRKQRTRLLALARRQHQHNGIAHTGFRRVRDHLQATTCKLIGEWLVALLTHQLRQGKLAHGHPFARTQEQYGTLGPSQRSAGKRQEQRIECGIGGAGRQSCVAWAWGSGHSTCVLAAPRLQPLPATSRGIPRSALQFAQGHRWRRIQHLARGEQTREQCRQHAQPTANDGQ